MRLNSDPDGFLDPVADHPHFIRSKERIRSRTSCLSFGWNYLLLALITGCLEFPGVVAAQQGFVHRGYLGWMVDFSRSPKIDKWPSISLDSSVIADFTETLDFLEKSGMNEVSAWGLFTDDGWDPDIGSTISPGRKMIVEELIKAAHEMGIKILCGMGHGSWQPW